MFFQLPSSVYAKKLGLQEFNEIHLHRANREPTLNFHLNEYSEQQENCFAVFGHD